MDEQNINSLINSEFPVEKHVQYMNHAAVAPWPQRAAQAVARFSEENVQLGASRYPQWLKTEQSLREQLAGLIHVDNASDIALAKNTSEALSIIAYGLDWHPGDEVIITNQEFPSNRIVWESLSTQGVNVVVANIDTLPTHEAILHSITPKTRLVSVSSVQYATGKKTHLEVLGSELSLRGILFCVDAIQSLGALAFDQQKINADFIVADGHKWMLGPEGLALLYVKPSIRDQLSLNQFGWHMVQHRGDYDRTDWEPANDATRFECGSPNMLSIHALQASLSLIHDIGMNEIERRVLTNAQQLKNELIKLPGARPLATQDEVESGIVTFKFEGADHVKLHKALMDANVICAQRGGGIRFSPHFYTSENTLATTIEKTARLLQVL